VRLKFLLITSLFAFGSLLLYADSWQIRDSIPAIGREGASSFVIGGKGYVATGSVALSGILNDLWEYDPVLNSWTQKASINTIGRTVAFAFSINGKGYVGGGIDDSSHVRKDFWEYNPILNQWNQKGNLDTSIKGATSFAINNKGYVICGDAQDGLHSRLAYEYDPIADNWTRKSNFRGAGRESASSFVIGNLGYVGFGTDYDTYFSDWYSYNPATDIWDTIASLPFMQGRFGATGFAVDGFGYTMGGFSYLNPSNQEVWQYEPVGNVWVQKNNFTGGFRLYASSFVINGHAFAGTGGAPTNTVRSDWWEYHPDPAGISEINSFNISLFPNPSNGTVCINMASGTNERKFLSIYNNHGSLIISTEAIENKFYLDLSGQLKGIYFVKVSQGDKTTTQKIIFM